MRSLTRSLVLLLLVLALVPMGGLIDSASANTELVPAARLVAPFVDISSGRDTFLLLTNVSSFLPLTRTPFSFANIGIPGVTISDSLGWGVHLEFYAASCATTSRTIDLTASDIDQLDLLVSPNMVGQLPGGPTTQFQSGVEGRGWVDIDIRRSPAAATDQSIQANVLMGTVVISDFAGDFALAYPMASSIGSAQQGVGGIIVGRAPITWTGRYEPFPPRVFVPAYFAEGTGTGSAAGQVFSTFLVIAGPADGNWSGVDSNDATANGNTGEPPGQVIGDGGQGGDLINIPNSLLFDGCEQRLDRALNGHYINNPLGTIYGAVNLNRANWTVANCTNKSFPGLDELSGQPVGWVDLPNTLTSKGTTTSSTRPAASSTGGIGVNRPRGMVGVFVESVAGGTPTAFKLGDVTRLWGDCSFTQTESIVAEGKRNCETSNGISTETGDCECSFVDLVCHIDAAASPGSFPTNLSALPASSCSNE